MFIINKTKDSIINAELSGCIYVGEDRHTVKAVVGEQSKMYRLGLYSSEDGAKIALEKLMTAIGEAKRMFAMPDDDEIEREIRHRSSRYPDKFASDGKKPVRHGGS